MVTLRQKALAGGAAAVVAVAVLGGVIFAQTPGSGTPTPPASTPQPGDKGNCPHMDGQQEGSGPSSASWSMRGGRMSGF
jgi:hypothetical protein